MKRTWRVMAILGMATVVLASLTPAVWAATYEDATARGFYDSRGWHDPANINYCAGWSCTSDEGDERNFMVFDLSGYSAQAADFGVSFARVVLANPFGTGTPVPYQLRNVSTPIRDLTAEHRKSEDGRLIYDDLASGKLYGAVTPGVMTDNPIQVDLNGEGLLALTKRLGNGKIAFGGSLRGSKEGDVLFGYSSGPPNSVQLQFQLGDKTSMTLKGPGRVARGSRVTYRGKVTSASAACVNGVELQITVGTRHSTVTTKADGSYAFKARIMRTTRLRAFYPGTMVVSPSDPCGGSEARKTVRLS